MNASFENAQKKCNIKKKIALLQLAEEYLNVPVCLSWNLLIHKQYFMCVKNLTFFAFILIGTLLEIVRLI
jgi:hypothetical protein